MALIFKEISLASILQIVIVRKYIVQNYHKILYVYKIQLVKSVIKFYNIIIELYFIIILITYFLTIAVCKMDANEISLKISAIHLIV